MWLTLSAYLLLLVGILIGATSLLAAGGMIWLVATSVNEPVGLLYVPIFVWLAFNMGLGLATVGRYRIGILSAHHAGNIDQAIRLSKVSPLVAFGAATNIDVGELPTTASVRWINRVDGRLGYLGLACLLVAVVVDRM